MKPFLPLLFLFVFAACIRKETPPLPPQKMQAVLSDIHLAEVYSLVINTTANPPQNGKQLDSLAKFYATILKHYKLSEKEFEQGLDWYKNHPEELDSVYQRMIPEFSKWEGANKVE